MGLKLLLILILVGCSDYNSEGEHSSLSVYMDLKQENGFYIYDYPNGRTNSYTYVRYNTEPISRVFWSSPDSFTIIHQGFPITSPIINYSTYSNENGDGKQFIYLNPSMVNDTLEVQGCIDLNCDKVQFIIQ